MVSQVVIRNAQRGVKILPEHKAMLQSALGLLLEQEREQGEWEVTLKLVAVKEIHRLNLAYRGQDTPTDVLSFPSDHELLPANPEAQRYLGDIALAPQMVAENARHNGNSFPWELTFAALHGLLHLCGYDHQEQALADEEDEALEEMHRKCLAILERLDML
ncbi:MAG: rRNA maturation RNase YbeY [Symbiobacteriaceae bacterium]|nr:rRNA maturation RNase YbeY [Symbiobacteriaceae bacterium]